MSITVHYGRDYDNAFWDGTQLVFGDGDGQIFERFTKPMDVMAHEFTHGVTQFTVGLAYQDQPGALNESISDVFASMAKQRMLGQTAAEADWLIAAGLFMPASMQRRCDRCWSRERRTTILKLAGICRSVLWRTMSKLTPIAVAYTSTQEFPTVPLPSPRWT